MSDSKALQEFEARAKRLNVPIPLSASENGMFNVSVPPHNGKINVINCRFEKDERYQGYWTKGACLKG